MDIDTVGRYQILGEIGRGGMATVYLALDPNFNRQVAVKLLPIEMMHNPDFRARFKKEIRTISSLEHPAIVPVYDSGEENGQLYFVMRYMAGGSLAERIKNGRLSLAEMAAIIEKLALGLNYAHQKGVIHRDIKPDNVLFDVENNPYLSDFGVSKLVEEAYSETGSGIVGTPAYVSPEQAEGKNDTVDHLSDIYGLGVLVFQMLTGEQPFKADTKMGVLVKHIKEPAPNILDVNPNLPPELETIIKTALAKRKDDRYQSVLEFARALSVAAFGPERTVPSALIHERKRIASSTRRGTAMLVGGAILLLLLAAAYFSLANPMLLPTPTGTASITPSAILPSATSEPPTSTVTITPTRESPTLVPTPNGGADQIALLSGNDIISMDLDGTNPKPIDTKNIEKSNLQWVSDGRLVYLSPTRNCAYTVNTEITESIEIICFRQDEKLEGFRISPDGTLVAISIARTLYIVPFDVDELNRINTRFLLEEMESSCHFFLPVKDVRWSSDGRRIAALVVDTQQAGSDQIHLFEVDILDCNSRILIPIDKFPAGRFPFGSASIPGYDWDGDHLFLLNDFAHNNGFGNLYLYDSESQTGKKINPVNGNCCYRDARWSPDGGYILFIYKNESDDEINLYYIATNDLLIGSETWTPVKIPPDLFKHEEPQPVLRPSQ